MDTEAFMQALVALAVDVVAAVVILAVGWWIAGWASRWVATRAERNERIDRTLASVFARIVHVAIVAFTVLAVLAQFGVQTTSFIAVLGAAGLAVGLALQGALSHFAAGILLVTLRPFKLGDAVEAGGITGTVEEIGLVATRLRTFDGVVVHQPNANVWSTEIKNYSQAEARRLDLVVGIGYDDDVGTAFDTARAVLAEDGRVLADPEPLLAVDSLGDNAVNVLVRAWTLPADLFPARFDLTRRLKERFEAAGLSIPYPQRDLHLVQAAPVEVKQAE